MQAVVLAAGKGTRLAPLTDDKPKALVEVDGTPFIEHAFDSLLELSPDGFVVVVGRLKEQIIERYNDEYGGVPITYAHQVIVPLVWGFVDIEVKRLSRPTGRPVQNSEASNQN